MRPFVSMTKSIAYQQKKIIKIDEIIEMHILRKSDWMNVSTYRQGMFDTLKSLCNFVQLPLVFGLQR